MLVVDAHAHVWSLDAGSYPWQPTIPGVGIPTQEGSVERLLALMDEHAVDKAVLVQPSVYGWDNSYVASCLERNPGRFSGVCLVDVSGPDPARDLAFWCVEKGFDGVRVNLVTHDDLTWMSRSSALWDVAEELDVPVCVQLHAWQVPALVVLARARPGLTFVIDSMPAASLLDVHRRTWLRAAAGCPNIRIKVLCGAPDSAEAHPFRDLWPFAAAAVEIFGSARVMLGSDFPYVENVAGYGQALTWLDGSATMAAADRSSLRGGTAATIWPSLCETSSTSPTP